MSMFLAGLFIGLVVGAWIGLLAFALCAAAKNGDAHLETTCVEPHQ